MKRKAAFLLPVLLLYLAAHYLATIRRGYDAIGGELVFLLVIPLGLYLLEEQSRAREEKRK